MDYGLEWLRYLRKRRIYVRFMSWVHVISLVSIKHFSSVVSGKVVNKRRNWIMGTYVGS